MQSSKKTARPSAQPTLILLIEDVAATAKIVKAYLEAAPGAVVVETVGSLGAALEKIAGRSYDLIITDLNLPDSTGLETLDRLTQATERLIIVLTIEEGREIRDAAIARGAYDFLQKDQLSQAALSQIVRLATLQANTFRALRESEARFRSLTELSSDWYWEQDAELRFVNTSGLTDKRGGITPGMHIGKSRWELPNTEIVNQTWDEHRAILAARKPFRDLLLRRADNQGEEHYVAVAGKAIFDAQGTFRGYQGVASDVTHRIRAEEALQRANEQLEQLALHDPLTGLANRRKFAERFEYDMARAVRARMPLSLLMVDIDHFKAVNDQHGHLAGDACLKALAAILAGSVRAVDLVARFGGEEFLVLLPEMSAEQSLVAAERMRSQVQAHPVAIEEGGPPLAITVSVGAATLSGPSIRLEDLLHRADEAVYCAKRMGRNQVCAWGAHA
jgi:diguanylate cyclase (GGDEF)-like protein/PAS domain S-box-containing protein